jgi:hypothetical protein
MGMLVTGTLDGDDIEIAGSTLIPMSGCHVRAEVIGSGRITISQSHIEAPEGIKVASRSVTRARPKGARPLLPTSVRVSDSSLTTRKLLLFCGKESADGAIPKTPTNGGLVLVGNSISAGNIEIEVGFLPSDRLTFQCERNNFVELVSLNVKCGTVLRAHDNYWGTADEGRIRDMVRSDKLRFKPFATQPFKVNVPGPIGEKPKQER